MADLLGGWRELFGLGEDVHAETVEEAWAVIREQVTGTAMFTPDQVDRVMRSFETAGEIADAYRPGTFDGDLLLFTAGRDHADHHALARMWRHCVTGRVHNTVVDARHLEMSHPDALAVVGAELERFAGRC